MIRFDRIRRPKKKFKQGRGILGELVNKFEESRLEE